MFTHTRVIPNPQDSLKQQNEDIFNILSSLLSILWNSTQQKHWFIKKKEVIKVIHKNPKSSEETQSLYLINTTPCMCTEQCLYINKSLN